MKGQQRTILVVDDDKDIRESLEELLVDQGFAVVCAEHGQHALELLVAQAVLPAVILLDIAMPVMDGFAFRTAQLANPAIAAVPIIVMTADGRTEDNRVRVGCKHAVNKPMDVDELLEILTHYA